MTQPARVKDEIRQLNTALTLPTRLKGWFVLVTYYVAQNPFVNFTCGLMVNLGGGWV